MPTKRSAATIEVDSEIGASQSSKRARTDDSDLEEPQPVRSGRSRGKERATNVIEVDEDEDTVTANPLNEDEERRFEEENEEHVRQQVMTENKGSGTIAEMGIIERLELYNFMCHQKLTFSFGPQINFIIGHNGSGKSAVLTALTIALGAKATATGRGSGLKSFIREGDDWAEVTVQIKNQGEDAYKPEVYGQSIIITRRFTREGSSSYKIKSSEGKLVSSKREELSHICDHMNIQVDNPMNILTQDSARQFLSASTPHDKYKFFLRGTQLSQLSEEYSTCMENIVQTQKVLKNKSEVIPDLEEALRDATARFKEADKARQQKHRADELKKELAWAHVTAKEEEFSNKLQDVEKQKRIVEKIEQDRAKQEKAVNSAEEQIAVHEKEIEELGELQNLEERRKVLETEIKKNKDELRQYGNERRQMNDELQNFKHEIERLEQAIKDETQRLQEATQGKRDEMQLKLQQAIDDLRDAEANMANLEKQRAQCKTTAQEIEAKGKALQQNDLESLKQKINNAQQQLRLIDQRARNALAPYGSRLEEVLAEIKTMRWYGQTPVGPLGKYVQAKEARWAPVLRVRLGGAMSGFAVTDARDRPQLEQLLKRYGNSKPSITIAGVDLFDYTEGEPPAEYPTMLRALQVSDEYVLRILINGQHIESTLVANTRAEADQMLRRLGAGHAWTIDSYIVERFGDGGGRSSLAPQLRSGDPRQQMFTGNDIAGDKNRYEQEIKDAQEQKQTVEAQIKDYLVKHRKCKDDEKTLDIQIAEAMRRCRHLKSIKDSVQEEMNQDLPVNIQSLQDALQEAEANKASTMAQFEEVERKKALVDADQHPLMEELKAIKSDARAWQDKRDAIMSRMGDAVQARLEAQSNHGHWAKKLKTEQAKLETLEAGATNLEETLAQWVKKAEDYCERVDKPRAVGEVQKQLDAVQKALAEREKRQGASIEEMTIEVNKKKEALETARRDLKLMNQLNKSLRKSIKVRLARWHEFRRHIALRCKIYFQWHLSNRGYYGKVLFDHVTGSLHLKVQTDDQVGTQGGNREKDPNSLSGGEKSFSTICLLLSLWESIGCPIRCLDEFDVFMDAVNRRISMKMMIGTANASDRKQYILITPQDMANVILGPAVRVHRMNDPERRQKTLPY